MHYYLLSLPLHSVWDTLDFEHKDLYLISLCDPAITTKGCEGSAVCVNTSIGGQIRVLGAQDACRVEYNPTSKTLLFSFKYENVLPFRDSYVNVSLICGNRAVSASLLHT